MLSELAAVALAVSVAGFPISSSPSSVVGAPTAPKGFALVVDWPAETGEARFTVDARLTIKGPARDDFTYWELWTYQNSDGQVFGRRLEAEKQTPPGTCSRTCSVTLRGETHIVPGYAVVKVMMADRRITVSAKARYKCELPYLCTLRKAFPTKVESWGEP